MLHTRLLARKDEFGAWLDHLQGPTHGRFNRWQRFMNSGNANDFLPEQHVAAFFDFADFLRERLLQGIDFNQCTLERQTPLCLAARGDSVESVKILLHAGADINAKGWADNTALSWAIDVENWPNCKGSGPFEVGLLLLEAGADPNLTYGAETPLYRACRIPAPDDPFVLSVVTLLLKHGASKHIDGHPREASPLACAAGLGAFHLVQLLLKNGADVNGGIVGDRFQRSQRNPLLSMCVQQNTNFIIVRLLLDAGANVDAQTLDGWTALHLSVRRTTQLTNLLLDYGAKVNVKAKDGSLPLHMAVREENEAALRALVGHGSDVNIEDATGRTPLIIAAENGYERMSQILLKEGASSTTKHWQVVYHDTKIQVRRMEQAYWPQTVHDISRVFRLLEFHVAKSNLPRLVTLEILNLARYWLKSTSMRAESVKIDENDDKSGATYLMSEPVRGCPKGCVRELRFVIRSHDQGFSDYPQHHGTYEESCTWFDIVVRKKDGDFLDFGTESRHLTANVHASFRTREHCLIYGRNASRRYSKWLDLLEPGDMIGVRGRAAYRGWVNYIESAHIEVMTTYLES
ncbi:hypothetical protein MMC27_004197 [Xylographa pallens]|nr:hypothetical protein [Xylographa pallens]